MFQYTAKQRTIRKSEKIKKSGLQGKVQEMLPHLKKWSRKCTENRAEISQNIQKQMSRWHMYQHRNDT